VKAVEQGMQGLGLSDKDKDKDKDGQQLQVMLSLGSSMYLITLGKSVPVRACKKTDVGFSGQYSCKTNTSVKKEGWRFAASSNAADQA